MQQSRHGDSIEIGLSLACLATGPRQEDLDESMLSAGRPPSVMSALEDADEDEEEHTPWEATLEISHTCAPTADCLAESIDPLTSDPLLKLLGRGLGISFSKMDQTEPSRRSWPILIKLDQTVPPAPPPEQALPQSASHKARLASEMTKEPSVSLELLPLSE